MKLDNTPAAKLRLAHHMYSDRDLILLKKHLLIDEICGIYVVDTKKATNIRVIFDCGVGYQAVVKMRNKIPESVYSAGGNFLFVTLE